MQLTLLLLLLLLLLRRFGTVSVLDAVALHRLEG